MPQLKMNQEIDIITNVCTHVNPEKPTQISKDVYIDPNQVIRIISAIIIFLLLMHLLIPLHSLLYPSNARFNELLVRFFHLNVEGSLPTIFSAALLFFASILLFLVYFFVKRKKRANG